MLQGSSGMQMNEYRRPEVFDFRFATAIRRGAAACRCRLGRCTIGISLAAAVAAVCAGPPMAAAQTVPAPAEPRPGLDRDRAPAPPPRPRLHTPRAPQVQPPANAAEVRFRLEAIEVQGATAYDAAVFRPFYEKLLGTEISLATLYGIATAIQKKYRLDGYVLSRAVVPPQTAKEGKFVIRVVEGYVDKVTLEGGIGPVRSLAEASLAKIAARRPSNIRDIERYLLLVNDLPGIRAIGVLRPSPAGPGAAELVVKAERDLVDGYLTVDNRESEFTGPVAAVAGLATNSLTMFGERISLVVLGDPLDQEQVVGQLSYEQRLFSEGLTLRLLGSYGMTEPGEELEALELESHTVAFGAALEYPLIRSRRLNLKLSGGFDYADLEQEALGTTLTEDNLRVVHLGAAFDNTDGLGGANRASLRIRQGVPLGGASEEGDANLSRAEGDGVFTTASLEAQRVQRIVGRLNLLARFGAQWALTELLSSEEYKLGNSSFGRGYDPSVLSGEHGAGALLELRYDLQFNPGIPVRLQPYAFADIGMVWNTDSNLASGLEKEHLMSAGLGVRLGLTRWFSADVELAQPLRRRLAGSTKDVDAPRIYGRITGRF